ncbi:KilA-N domain-containing protein [Gemmata sp. G18]|uniref:KilA-N domain-containing protein n=1 Tax=Gemmata palustris TaxID=2822762 RepID=A0ABS5BSP6_9BACT|nr:KilA-N domain-containing protein [Gemmata palustris]MBP3956754.1 KilA-N domain-containing protein [Gemmata palustris]
MANELVKVIGSTSIRARASDKYVDATALCKAAKKKWADYFRLGGTKEFVQALVQSAEIPADSLIEMKSGKSGGTCIHPRVVIHFAQWASAEFAARSAVPNTAKAIRVESGPIHGNSQSNGAW